jgi:hypothetical protein
MKTRENFCKSCFWFKSNQILFAKLLKKIIKEKGKRMRKGKRGRRQRFGLDREMAHGPSPPLFRIGTKFPPLLPLTR